MLDVVEELFQQGVELHKSGKVEVASQLYTAVLKAQPEHPTANHNMGILAVGGGKVQEALPYFEAALEANADTAQFWLSYIAALIEVERIADAQAVFDQAKSNGAKGDGFDQLERRLNVLNEELLETSITASEAHQDQPNILETLKLDQALRLAKKTAKEGSLGDAKRIYQDVLLKFPKNQRAIDGIKALAGVPVGKASEVQDPPQGQLQSLINLYTGGELHKALDGVDQLLQQFPNSITLFNIQGASNAGLGRLDAAIAAYNSALAIKPDYAEAYNNMGAALRVQGKLEEAIEAYTKALAIKPDFAEAYYNIGTALQDQGKLEEAIEAYTKALSIKPDYVEAYYNIGTALKEHGKVEEAIEAFNKALVLKPDYVEAYYNMATALKGQGKLEEAIEAYIKVLSLKPDYAEAFNNMGNALKEQGKLEEAIEAYNKALAIKPDYAEAYNNMGFALQEQGKLEEAIEAYTKALVLKPDYADAYYNMGNALQEQGKLEEAIEAYIKALSLKPDYAEAYNNMGNVLQEQDNLEEAIEAYNKAIAIKSDYAEAYYNMGNVLKEQGKLEDVIASYNKALAVKPDYAEAYYNMGVVLQKQGELEEAIGAFNKALSIKPDFAVAYYNMGNALQDQGKLEEAIEAYEKALSIKPDYAEAYNNMGVILQGQGKLEEAIETYNKAIALKPDFADAYYNTGTALQDQGKLEEAIEAFNKALVLKPDYAEAYNNMGVTLKEQGKLEEAIKACNKAIAIKPDLAQTHHNLSFALLNNGRLSEGLDEYEWRWKTAEFSRWKRLFSQPLWDGKTSLKGKRILVWCEQGVGDTVMWSSRLSLLASQAGHCILECQEKLIPLLSRSFPNVEVKSEDRSRDTKRDDFDFHLPMGSLCRHFITEITQNPRPDAFLIPDPVRIKFWKDRLSSLGSGPWVGISWKSSLMGGNRWKHFSSISEWSSLLTLPNIDFINLQYADAADDLLQIQNEFGVKVHNFDDLDQFNNLDDVAALSAALDCVVSVGTSVPMITAGVGTSTKCALLANGEYNNILGGPVGPLVDKFEKNRREPWSSVFSLIAEDIIELAGSKG